MTRPARRSAARVSSAASASPAVMNGNGAPRTDLVAVRSAVAESFDQVRQFLQFLVYAQERQCGALKAWDDAANTAEHAIEKASGWAELVVARNDLLRDGLSRMMDTQFALALSWFELQARLLQQAQHRALNS